MTLKRSKKPLRSKKKITRGKPLAQMSAKKREQLAAKGIVNPSTTFTPPKLAAATTVKVKWPAQTGFDAATTEAILEREGFCCGRCGGALHGVRGFDYSIQHRRARGAGGTSRPDTNQPQNGLALCGSATSAGGCHQYVESYRTEAEEHGWAVSQYDDPLLKPVDHHLHGWIYLWPNGSWGSRPWQEEASV